MTKLTDNISESDGNFLFTFVPTLVRAWRWKITFLKSHPVGGRMEAARRQRWRRIGELRGTCGEDFAHETATTKLPQHHHPHRSRSRFALRFPSTLTYSSRVRLLQIQTCSSGCGYLLLGASQQRVRRHFKTRLNSFSPSLREVGLNF